MISFKILNFDTELHLFKKFNLFTILALLFSTNCELSKAQESLNNSVKYDFSTGYSQLAEDIMPSVVSITATKTVKPSKQDIERLEQIEELFNLFGLIYNHLF